MIEVDGNKGRTAGRTFAGLLANSQLAGAFASLGSRPDNLSITINQTVLPHDFRKQLDASVPGFEPARFDQADLVKFQDCVPGPLLTQMQASRSRDPQAVEATRTARLIFRNMT